MKKALTALLCIVMAGMVLGGCAAGRAGSTTATTSPAVTSSPMATATAKTQTATAAPQATAQPDSMAGGTAASGMTGAAANESGMTAAQAGRTAEKIEEAVERLSEIDDAEVVLDGGSRVLVAVEFDDQYSAGLDERMKQMITEAVQKVDDGLTDVEITDDSTLYGQVKSLGERLAKATGLDELTDDFGDLWNRLTGM